MRHIKKIRIAFLGLIFLIACPKLFSQSKNHRIAAFIQVWGFLKYHHPVVATGKLDWDSVYINELPLIEKVKSDQEFNKRLLTIINNLGPILKKQSARLPDSLFSVNHNLNWITSSKIFDNTVKQTLKEIYKYRNQEGGNKYIKLEHSTANFNGEKRYDEMVLPQENYRSLFLARYWNIINYFAPYKYLIGEDWNKVLFRFIPQIHDAVDTVKWYKVLMRLAVSVNDGHARLNNDAGNNQADNLVFGENTSPFYITIIDKTIIIRKFSNDSLCAKANIQKGDIIEAVDGEPIKKRISRISTLESASNITAKNYALPRILLNTHNTSQTLKIKRANKTIFVTIKCIKANERSWSDLNEYTYNDKGYKPLGNSIAYVYASQIWDGNVDSISTLIKNKKAVIFDSRNYGLNYAYYKLLGIFFNEQRFINLSLIMSPINPGYFSWKKSIPIVGGKSVPYTGKVIILVDERNQSQGEYTAMALQTIPNAITIGSQTSGLDGISTVVPMGGKMGVSYSGYGVYYPDKTITQRRGIKIDILVKKTLKTVMKNQDVALDKALTYLKAQNID